MCTGGKKDAFLAFFRIKGGGEIWDSLHNMDEYQLKSNTSKRVFR